MATLLVELSFELFMQMTASVDSSCTRAGSLGEKIDGQRRRGDGVPCGC